MTHCSDRRSAVADVAYRQLHGWVREGPTMSVIEVDEAAILSRVGANIAARRSKARLTQMELAAKAGIDRAFLSGVENGKRNLSVVLLARLAAALNASVSDLVRHL